MLISDCVCWPRVILQIDQQDCFHLNISLFIAFQYFPFRYRVAQALQS